MAKQRNYLMTGQSPELFDKVFEEMSAQLKASLGWLDEAFGRVERTVKLSTTGKRIYTPCVYFHGNEYTELLPDSNVGNFSFFWVDDPQQITWDRYVSVGICTDFSVIFWYDFRKVYNGTNRNREQVKADILDALNSMALKHGGFVINRVYELAENIYRGFSLDEVDNQFLMQPYGGIRLEGEIWVTKTCTHQQANQTNTKTL